MKKVLFFAVAAFCALATSCSTDDSTSDKVFNFEKDLLEQSVPYDAAYALSLSFTAPANWSARSDSEWLSVEPDHGEAGSYIVELKLLKNTSKDARTANVELVCGSEKLTVSVTQAGAPSNPLGPAAEPDRYVKKISNYWESDYYDTGSSNSIHHTFQFTYDDQKRVVRIDEQAPNGPTGEDIQKGWVTLDYSSKEGSIILKNKPYYYNDDNQQTWEASLGDGGYVTGFFQDLQSGIVCEREGRLLKTLSYTYRNSNEEIRQEALVCTYDEEGKLTDYLEDTFHMTFKYSMNYPYPNINVDLNWLIIMGLDASPFSFLLLRKCGDLGAFLLEQPRGAKEDASPGFAVENGKQPGRYHYEQYYHQRAEDATYKIEEDSKRYPVKIIFNYDIEEWLYECDYTVDAEGVPTIDKATEHFGKTGKILGYNNRVYAIEYVE